MKKLLHILLFSAVTLSATESMEVLLPVQEWDKLVESGISFEDPLPEGVEVSSVDIETTFFWPYHEAQELEGIWRLNENQVMRESLAGERGKWTHAFTVKNPKLSDMNEILFLNPLDAWIFVEGIRLVFHYETAPSNLPVVAVAK